jgi:hypothetical protein
MSTPLRSILSASIGPGLTVFTAWSLFFHGPLAISTTIGFSLTLVWGMIELALGSYTPISAIDLDGPSLLDDDESADEEASRVVRFPEKALREERAA